MKRTRRDRIRRYAGVASTTPSTPEVFHVSPSRTLPLARRSGQPLARPCPRFRLPARAVELRHDLGATLRPEHGRLATVPTPGRPLRQPPPTPPRVLQRSTGQGRRPTRYQTPRLR